MDTNRRGELSPFLLRSLLPIKDLTTPSKDSLNSRNLVVSIRVNSWLHRDSVHLRFVVRRSGM